MFGNQRLWIKRRTAQSWQILAVANVSERNANIAKESSATNPPDWRIVKQIAKFSFIEP